MKSAFNYNIEEEPIQLDFCCVPYAIKLILRAEGLKEMSQLEIAEYLNLKIPPRNAEDFVKLYKGEMEIVISKSDDDYGCHIKDLNRQFFMPSCLPLKEIFIPAKSYSEENIINLIKRSIDEERHIIIPVYYSILSEDDEIDKKRGKHVILIEGYDEKMFLVVVPFEKGSFKKEFTHQHVYNSMVKEDNGLWLISRSDK